MISAYPKIFNLGVDYIKDIFNEEVEITEKVDGSQFGFGKIEGEVICRSKGKRQMPDQPDKMFKTAVDYIMTIEEKLPDNMFFYAEYLNKPKHNQIKYGRIPKNNLILFGARTKEGEILRDYSKYAEMFDIELVPVLFKGKINSPVELKELMKTISILGEAEIEGIVVKNYDRKFLLGGQEIPLMCGKFVSEKFKEVMCKPQKEKSKAPDKLQEFCESFKTEARWNKAVQHLKENGELENTPRDIGKLMREVNIDIESEEKENIKEFLWNLHKRLIFSSAIRGMAQWYKEKVVDQSFNQ